MVELLEKTAPARGGSGGPLDLGAPGGGEGPFGDRPSADPSRFGLWAFLGTVSMLFIGFTSAYILRRASADWQPLVGPRILWFNSAALFLSSATLETARRRLRSWDLPETRAWLAATGLLGALFVAGQVAAWRALAAQGIFLASNPHSSFFYLLTGVHVTHLVGGLAWYAVVQLRMRRLALVPGQDGLGLFATYWHFLGALWAYLLFLLFVL
jgi:cytochrome c oxidase subunit 3